MPICRRAAVPTDDLPKSEQWRDLMLDAAILGAAMVARAEGAVRPTARMALLAATRRSGLLGTPPQCDVHARLAAQFAILAHPVAARRAMVRAMNPFVGTPWAETIAAVVGSVAQGGRTAQADCAVLAVRRALGLAAADGC